MMFQAPNKQKIVSHVVSTLLLPGYLDLSIWRKQLFSFIIVFSFTLSQFHNSSLTLLIAYLLCHMSQQKI